MRLPQNTISLLTCMAVLMGSAGLAFAQDEGAPTDVPVPPETKGTGSVESDLDLYWGGKRDVSIVQKRLFRKDGRIELTAFTGMIPNDPFLTYIPVGGRIGYYFLESIAVEVAGSYVGDPFTLESDLTTFLKNERNIQANVDLLDIQIWRVNAAVAWSPFYGKLALLQRKLSHFDINLVAGFGALQVESPDKVTREAKTTIKPEGLLGAGFRFFMTNDISLRLDYRQGIFQKVGGGVSTPSEVTFGFSYMLGG